MNDQLISADNLTIRSPEEKLTDATNRWLSLLLERAELNARIYDEKGHYRDDHWQYDERQKEVRKELQQIEEQRDAIKEVA